MKKDLDWISNNTRNQDGIFHDVRFNPAAVSLPLSNARARSLDQQLLEDERRTRRRRERRRRRRRRRKKKEDWLGNEIISRVEMWREAWRIPSDEKTES